MLALEPAVLVTTSTFEQDRILGSYHSSEEVSETSASATRPPRELIALGETLKP